MTAENLRLALATQPGPAAPRDLAPLVDAVCDAAGAPVPVAARAMAAALGEFAAAASVTLLKRVDGRWTTLCGPPALDGGRSLAALLDQGEAIPCDVVASVADAAVVVQGQHPVGPDLPAAVTLTRRFLELVVERDAASEAFAQAGQEVGALQRVAGEILSVQDLDQVLLSITTRVLALLDADICGVFLVEGEELVMRSCAGHRTVETERLTIRRGQGVAGQVFETGKPCNVDCYLEDSGISTDFRWLARQESAQSALGVPLLNRGELIGVLEVWRRRPSVFTEHHVRRLVALANLATIAIENARLYEQQAESVAQLHNARVDLEQQVERLRRSASLQGTLLEAVLSGDDHLSIARTIATEMACEAVIFSIDMDVLAAYPQTVDVDRVRQAAAAVAPRRTDRAVSSRSSASVVALPGTDHARLWTQYVWAGRDVIGMVCLVSHDQSDEMMEIARGEAALACALQHLKQRAASRARSEARDDILWDLLKGPFEQRVAAISRAERMHIELHGPHRVVHGVLETLTELARAEGWDTSATDHARRQIVATAQRVIERHSGQLVSMRGDLIVAIIAVAGADRARALIGELHDEIAAAHPAVRAVWGISAPQEDPLQYPEAFAQAKTAVSAARRFGGQRVQVFDDLGVVRLLLGPGQAGDLWTFVRDVIGPLIDYDAARDGALLDTLRAYFDADCSQKLAARRLHVHYKTLRYRLQRINELTNLDLSRHEDRMRVDLALRIYQVDPAAPERAGTEP